jgi:hypothetical protein
MFLLVLVIWPTSLKTARVGVPNFFIAVLSMITRTAVTVDVCILWVDCVWVVMEHRQKPDFVFRRNRRVKSNRRGRQFSRLLTADVCASALVMLHTTCSEVVWRVLATHSIRQFLLHFPSRTSPCAITFQLDSNSFWRPQEEELLYHYSAFLQHEHLEGAPATKWNCHVTYTAITANVEGFLTVCTSYLGKPKRATTLSVYFLNFLSLALSNRR